MGRSHCQTSGYAKRKNYTMETVGREDKCRKADGVKKIYGSIYPKIGRKRLGVSNEHLACCRS